MFDTLEHFYFPKANARGSAIRLQETWQTILERRAYPEPVQRLLGEMTAGADGRSSDARGLHYV